jgi:hypothetical protein
MAQRAGEPLRRYRIKMEVWDVSARPQFGVNFENFQPDCTWGGLKCIMVYGGHVDVAVERFVGVGAVDDSAAPTLPEQPSLFFPS